MIRRMHDRFEKLEPAERGVLKLGVVCVVLAMFVGALGIALSAQATAHQANTGVQGSCQFWRDLAQLPLSPQSTKVAFTIIADSRVAYDRQNCAPEFGELPAPDPRVAPLLPNGVR